MFIKEFFLKIFKTSPRPVESDNKFSGIGIRWYEWSEETEKLIAERNRPVLLYVANPDPMVWPFLKAVFNAMPQNEKLRELLSNYYIALFMKADAVPEYFSSLGVGSRYNLAILSPAGLTPLVTIDPVPGKPEQIVTTITKVLSELQKVY